MRTVLRYGHHLDSPAAEQILGEMLYRQPVQKFLDRVRGGKVCLGAHTSLMSPQAIELYGLAGLDYVILGTEVEPLDYGPMENLMRAANAAGIVPIIKLRRPDADVVSDIMNFGGSLVITPHITSAEQLRAMVAATRFGSAGTRGECPIGRYTGYGTIPLNDSRTMANESNCIIPLIEDVEALDHLDEIFAVEGIDMVTIGPFDFSRSLNMPLPGYKNPGIFDIITRIAEAARRHGKAIMVPLYVTAETVDSSEKIIKDQVEKFVSNGITVFYRPDLHILADFFHGLMPMRGITVRDEEEAADGLADGVADGLTDGLEDATALERHVPGKSV